MTSHADATVPRDRRSGRRAATWLPWVILALWVAGLVGVMPFAMELDSAQSDEPIDYLPASADSTKVIEVEAQLPGGDSDDYIVAYYRESGLTDADRAVAERQRASLLRQFGGEEDGADPPVRSGDGTALMYLLPVGTDQGEPDEVVLEVRQAVADRPAGLDAKVTGSPALEADLDEVFDGIDETLVIATMTVVTILLILTYRSPVLWLLPLLVVGTAAIFAMGLVYLLIQAFGITVSTQTASILIVLVFGAGTDYALLLVARYREELRQTPDVRSAMWAALRAAGPAIVASAGTVVAGMLCLLAADLNSSSGLGPVGAAGIVCALVAMLTLFPALLVVLGRWVFWPRVPRVGTGDAHGAGGWARLGRLIARRRVLSTAAAVTVLTILALGLLGPTDSLRDRDQFLDEPESVAGFVLLTEHFPEQSGQPITVLTRPAQIDQVLSVASRTPGIAQAIPGRASADWAEVTAFPTDEPGTPEETATIERLRAGLAQVAGAEALVGGPSAEGLDQVATSQRDRTVVMPLVLVVVLVILCLLLRAIVAPLILLATVVLSFAAALGASVFIFDTGFGFEGLDHSVPLLGFLFLIALGIDYNIFLIGRAREEATRHGTRQGILRSLASTGGVITSAGLVLAATFSVLATLPVVLMVQVGFVVAFGVLLDTFLVRSVLVPAVTLLTGRWIWWPGRLHRRRDEPVAAGAAPEPPPESLVGSRTGDPSADPPR